MSSSDHEKERVVKPAQRKEMKPEQRREYSEAMPTNHYLSTLSSDEQNGQSGGNQADSASDNNSSSQSREMDAGNESR